MEAKVFKWSETKQFSRVCKTKETSPIMLLIIQHLLMCSSTGKAVHQSGTSNINISLFFQVKFSLELPDHLSFFTPRTLFSHANMFPNVSNCLGENTKAKTRTLNTQVAINQSCAADLARKSQSCSVHGYREMREVYRILAITLLYILLS